MEMGLGMLLVQLLEALLEGLIAGAAFEDGEGLAAGEDRGVGKRTRWP